MDHIKFAENHMNARASKKFDPVNYCTPTEMLGHLEEGKTFEFILNRIEDALVHPVDLNRANNGFITHGYKEAVNFGFLLFTDKLKKWIQKSTTNGQTT
jgi:hypothetical protein